MNQLAAATSISSIHHLPWWQQLAIGVGLMLLGIVLDKIEDKADSGFLGFAAIALGIAGFFSILSAIF